MHTLSVIGLIILILIVLSILVILTSEKKEGYVDGGSAGSSIVNMMKESPARRLQFAAALLSYDPRVQKYQDPRKYDFHMSGTATQTWKKRFESYIGSIADGVLEQILSKSDMIVLFNGAELVGDVIFIPLEGTYPHEVVDKVMYNKYIKWSPPTNMISAIVPEGYRVEVAFADGSVKDIPDGITPTFIIVQPIKSMTVKRLPL